MRLGVLFFEFFTISILAFVLQFSVPAQAQVWQATNTWSPQWEKAFEEWVQSQWRTDFFSRRVLPSGEANPFLNLRADCADTVYSMRIIFSYQNHLPFVAVDPTGGRQLVSERMTRWNSLAKETDRVRQFLLFAYDTFSTVSLPADTYPVAISRETVRAGGLMTTTAKNHHSWTIQNVLNIGVPHLVFNSTIGAGSGSGLQERTSWPNPEWVFEGNFSPSGHAGLRYWRQPQDLQKPVWQVPGYSDEQYQISLSNWIDVVQRKLALVNETPSQKIQRLLEVACSGAQGRVAVVKGAIDFQKMIGGRCLTYSEYDTYSSPNRDRRVFDDLIALRRAYKSIVNANSLGRLPPVVVGQLNKIFPAIQKVVSVEQAEMGIQTVDSNSSCVFRYGSQDAGGEVQMDLAEYRRRSFSGQLSNNPNDSFEQRWGLTSASPKNCQAWEVWAPNLAQED